MILSDGTQILDSVSHHASTALEEFDMRGDWLRLEIPPEARFLTLASGAGAPLDLATNPRFYYNSGAFGLAVLTPGVAGDMDGDGDIDFDDIDDFVQGLTNPQLYESIHGVPAAFGGDFDGDGDQDFDDIDGFVQALSGGAQSVPEPSALLLSAIGLFGIVYCCQRRFAGLRHSFVIRHLSFVVLSALVAAPPL
jgi:hypothetical protein